MFSKTKHDQSVMERDIQLDNIPKHIAIIMDGNGRWAKKRGLPRVAGHREGMNTIRRTVRQANKYGVKILTLYAFSTENWKRPRPEVEFLMRLPERFLSKELPELIEQNVRVRITGEKDKLPEYTKRAVEKAVAETAHNDGLILNFALNYGSRSEMIQGIQSICRDVKDNNLSIDEIDEACFTGRLMTHDLDDPDLLIRTSGEIRLSNFMLWQLAYAEFWFTNVLWPDFKEDDFQEAILVYQNRQRRYGGV
ncbi:isoprenyl transferase [Salisediminibacterium selenitireducens]|uniref:Isoprenyl transferase n=1 Tax=Bacillus selenitireducens (strain ATCC 700615 / DSM 15326 / MLS10) TaxID=439292 RepID=D6XTZ9_BACIE|nr:isoprenyl transferase [Salisediminibacterium selenitireducens]ADH99285.1 undecaprenyl diphosphate synthase [[Bacillus] selenitireducens MLS10]